MAGTEIRIYRAALNELAHSDMVRAGLEAAADGVRDRARVSAAPISARLAAALDTESGEDTESQFVDVGYNKRKPGWVLWFAEVGTTNQRAQPHLRPALRPDASL